jgi:hypothetical protein
MKTVGKRAPAVGWAAFDELQRLAMKLGNGKAGIPKGVYPFKSHEDAQKWHLKMITRPERGSRR